MSQRLHTGTHKQLTPPLNPQSPSFAGKEFEAYRLMETTQLIWRLKEERVGTQVQTLLEDFPMKAMEFPPCHFPPTEGSSFYSCLGYARP